MHVFYDCTGACI